MKRAAEKRAIAELFALHRDLKDRIDSRRAEFRRVFETYSDEDLFGELSFCTLTPQSKAHQCWKAIEELKRTGLLMNGTAGKIASALRAIHGVRFHNNKARYITANRKAFFSGDTSLRSLIDPSDIIATRLRLVEAVEGIGIKEASHFLRNIGFGDTVAIIDRHVLRNLVPLGILRRLPDTLTDVRYREIEIKMTAFCDAEGITLADLDFVLWFREAGDVFK